MCLHSEKRVSNLVEWVSDLNNGPLSNISTPYLTCTSTIEARAPPFGMTFSYMFSLNAHVLASGEIAGVDVRGIESRLKRTCERTSGVPAKCVVAAEARLASQNTLPLRFGHHQPFIVSSPLLTATTIYFALNQITVCSTFS